MSGAGNMEKKEQLEKQIRRLKQIREDLGMNRTEFSLYMGIEVAKECKSICMGWLLCNSQEILERICFRNRMENLWY